MRATFQRLFVSILILLPACLAIGGAIVRTSTNFGIGQENYLVLMAAVAYLITYILIRHHQTLSINLVVTAWLMVGAGAGHYAYTKAAEKRGDVNANRVNADGYRGKAWVPAYFREWSKAYRSEWHPFVYWRRVPFDGEYVRVDAAGRRHTWNQPEDSAGSREIFMFGGSALWGTGARDDYTIPSQVSRLLANNGHSVRVTNFGESGYVTTQNLIALILELRKGNIPDVVVFYDGANNAYSALQNREAGIPQNEMKRRLAFARTTGFPYKSRDQDVDDDTLVAQFAELYFGDLEVAAGLAKQYGFTFLAYSQPVAAFHKQLTAYERSTVDARDPAERAFLRKAYVKLREASSLPYYRQLTDVFMEHSDSYYIDFVHINEEGNAVIAAEIARDIAAILGSP